MSLARHAAPAVHRKQDKLMALLMQAQQVHQRGDIEQARGFYKQVLKKHPNHFDALHLLGVCEHQTGNQDSAERLVRRAIMLDSASAAAYSNMSAILSAQLRFADALDFADRALVLDSDFADAHFNRGNALAGLHRNVDAIESFDASIALMPSYANAFNNKGNALHRLRRFAEALECYSVAVRLKPTFLLAHVNRGAVHLEIRHFSAAVTDFECALALDTSHTGAWVNRGEALFACGQRIDALRSFDKALSLDRTIAEAWLGRGNVLLHAMKVSEALEAYTEALKINPEFVNALSQLGQCHAFLGDIEAANACIDRALALKPYAEAALSNRIYMLDFIEGAGFEQHWAARSEWWRQIGAKIAVERTLLHDNARDSDKRIVVGYVSGDFRQHSAAFAFRPVLRNHDKSRFEVVCYSVSAHQDAVTETFKACADRWRDVSQMSDGELAEQVKADGVDILVDLSGHSFGNRLRSFSLKPAPVQVTAWGHATGTGLQTMDYLFSDPVAIPDHARHLHAEKIADLPCLIIVEEPPAGLHSAALPRATNGYTTYGIFNRITKFSDAAIALWARILDADPTSRLLIKDTALDDARVQATLLGRFTAQGVAADRITLLGATSREEHLAAYASVDVGLDTFPQGGGVSTWEALYMGVPVVAKLGIAVGSRLSGAILSAVGLNDWVVDDDEAYIARALGATLDELADIRARLPDMIAERCSPAAYTRAVEEQYRAMWTRYCEESTS
ncbi:tetratricopeptide repeat protein [Tardiphaga robiniae]|uniref:protein O-GlcNAc transferase n=1 Tax=Tardiphaga robiniae TaxID=943830 RepID=A0A161QZP4_9BRAD|nr:tetratricopeptide repeat protein [Tardiphaga robiniae]KZD21721.1 peptide transporter [Tardiphaga robiniae]